MTDKNKCMAAKKPFINKKQKRVRLRFAKDHKHWTVEDWSKAIFPDEHNFQLCPTSGRLMFRWRPGEAYTPRYLAATVQFGAGLVMIWGASARLESDTFGFVKGA